MRKARLWRSGLPWLSSRSAVSRFIFMFLFVQVSVGRRSLVPFRDRAQSRVSETGEIAIRFDREAGPQRKDSESEEVGIFRLPEPRQEDLDQRSRIELLPG